MNNNNTLVLVFAVVLVVVVLFATQKCNLDCGKKKNEPYQRSELGQSSNTVYGRSNVDYYTEPHDNPHYKGNPEAKFQQLEGNTVDLYREQRKLDWDSDYKLFDQYTTTWKGSKYPAVVVTPDGTSRNHLAQMGDVDVAKQASYVHYPNAPHSTNIANQLELGKSKLQRNSQQPQQQTNEYTECMQAYNTTCTQGCPTADSDCELCQSPYGSVNSPCSSYAPSSKYQKNSSPNSLQPLCPSGTTLNNNSNCKQCIAGGIKAGCTQQLCGNSQQYPDVKCMPTCVDNYGGEPGDGEPGYPCSDLCCQ